MDYLVVEEMLSALIAISVRSINDLDIVDVNDESELKSRVAANKYISCVVRVLILRPLVYGEMINSTVGKVC